MDKSIEFENFRKEYKDFIFQSYSITEEAEEIILKYDFEIVGLARVPSMR